ncbi:MAG: hypothetical protein RL341_2323, partial [Pseudomonadota bacterium]
MTTVNRSDLRQTLTALLQPSTYVGPNGQQVATATGPNGTAVAATGNPTSGTGAAAWAGTAARP